MWFIKNCETVKRTDVIIAAAFYKKAHFRPSRNFAEIGICEQKRSFELETNEFVSYHGVFMVAYLDTLYCICGQGKREYIRFYRCDITPDDVAKCHVARDTLMRRIMASLLYV